MPHPDGPSSDRHSPRAIVEIQPVHGHDLPEPLCDVPQDDVGGHDAPPIFVVPVTRLITQCPTMMMRSATAERAAAYTVSPSSLSA